MQDDGFGNTRLTMHAMRDEPNSPETVRDCSRLESAIGELADSLKLFADPTRLQLLQMLARDGEMNVNTMCMEVGQSQPAVSHHLGLMRMSGLISRRRQGKFNYYRIDQHELRSVFDQLACLSSLRHEFRPPHRRSKEPCRIHARKDSGVESATDRTSH